MSYIILFNELFTYLSVYFLDNLKEDKCKNKIHK